jgi:hypothetical protein
MPKITKVLPKPDRKRVWIYIDGKFCLSARERTWQAMGLGVGSQISCAELEEKENFFWKQAYGESSWEKEKVRLGKISDWINERFPELEVDTKGFGADSLEMIDEHPEESGAPDLALRLPDISDDILAVEVTGTEHMRGSDYWVRPDKIQYAKNHPDKDVWVALHFQKPQEKIIWIKPDLEKDYPIQEIEIRGAGEEYIIFTDNNDEVKTEEDVVAHIRSVIEQAF